jgi:hypothetical protein
MGSLSQNEFIQGLLRCQHLGIGIIKHALQVLRGNHGVQI